MIPLAVSLWLAACPGPQTCMTPQGETVRGVFRRWPKGDPAIDWSKTASPIVSPQIHILNMKHHNWRKDQ